MTLRICAGCGEPSTTTWCSACRSPETKTAARGYGNRWRVLSEKARELSPFCAQCGTTEQLSLDHSSEAWRRYYEGKAIRLQDCTVLCKSCNSKAGRKRPDPGGVGAPEVDHDRRAGEVSLSRRRDTSEAS